MIWVVQLYPLMVHTDVLRDLDMKVSVEIPQLRYPGVGGVLCGTVRSTLSESLLRAL